jgi:mediator of RNA polymerase II transcription subunit 7
MQQLYTPPSSPSNGNGKHIDRAFILKRLAKSLLLNFLELVGIMSMNPDQYPDKLDDMNSLFLNFHHLLNEYRPHQARESLIMMMRDQLEKSRAETRGVREMKAKVEEILEGLAQAKLGSNGASEGTDIDKEQEEGKDIWEELCREFGE